MTPRKDVANNIEQAAQDLMVYLLTFKDQDEKTKLQTKLSQILELAKKEYDGEEMSYFTQWFIYHFSRTRSLEAAEALKEFNDCLADPFARFVILVDLLTNGACKSTSLNTRIIDKLIEATGKYQPIKEDELNEAESDVETTHKRFKKVFLEKAHIEQKRVEKEAEEKKARENTATKALNNSISSLLINKNEYKEIQAKLSAFLKSKVNKIADNNVEDQKENNSVQRAKSLPIDIKNAKIKSTDKFKPQQTMLLEVFARRKEREEKKAAENSKLTSARRLTDNPVLANARASMEGFFKVKAEKKLAQSTPVKAKEPGSIKERYAEQMALISEGLAKKFGAKI
jgi:hypothetical protein